MKRRILLISLFAASSALAGETPMPLQQPSKPAPELQFTDGDGKTRTLVEFKGKVVLLNIWATWCAACRKEMPTLDRLQATLGGPDFEVVPLSIDNKGMEAVVKFYAEIGIQHLGRYVAPSSTDVMGKLAVFGIPATYLISKQGQILAHKDGPAEWDTPDMINFLSDFIHQQKGE